MIDTETLGFNSNINKMEDENLSPTPIQEFYKDSVIFMTGSTGFLGQVMLEKLLRSCPGISTIYILVRNKKGKNVESRVEDIFDEVIFDRVKKECPKYKHKVVGIVGDCSLPNLGMSQKDINTLIDNVNIVFHVAATVRFDEKLKTAVAINVRATEEMFLLAHKMPNLKSIIHVSTAYSNCNMKTIEEKVYPSPIDYKKMIVLTENLPDKILDPITPKILKPFPNTYAFTKQIAEDVVGDLGKNLPCGIFRPAIVVSTYKEPVKAWINNIYGPTGIVTGAAVGLVRTIHCDKNANANIVPVDMCVNSLIASAWEVGTNFKNKKKHDDIPVYNYESQSVKPITWEDFMSESKKYGLHKPTNKAIWYYTLTLQKFTIFYYITRFFLHILPALLVDLVLICMGKSPKMLKVYNKIHKFAAVISYFSTQTFHFKSQNVLKLCDAMSDRDKDIFFSDMRKLNWDEFFQSYCWGIRLYTVKDPDDTIEEAKVKFNRLYWAHQATKTVIAFALLRLLWFLFTSLSNLIY